MDTRVQELIKVRSLMNQLEAKEKSLLDELKSDDTFEGYKGDDAVITKTIRKTVVLKEGTDNDFLMEMFPTAVKQSLDMNTLRDIQEAHQFMEMKETQVVSVKLK